MACLPGMPCYQTGPVYPEGMGPCPPVCLDASQIVYNGNNLPCSGVNTGDSLDIALEKIDSKICPEYVLNAILILIRVNPTFHVQFCELVNGCLPTTTTTTTLL